MNTQPPTTPTFQQRLADARSTHGLLHRIALRARVSPSLVWRLAHGKRSDTRTATASRIVEALDELAPLQNPIPSQQNPPASAKTAHRSTATSGGGSPVGCPSTEGRSPSARTRGSRRKRTAA